MSDERKQERLGRLAAIIIRLIGGTLRIRVVDRAGLLKPDLKQPFIWTFWHNRMFMLPLLRDRFVRHRSGSVLTSASKDGAILAAVMESFGIRSVRGSSSRRAVAALLELTSVLEAGEDVAVTPDGPRGPCYTLGPGVVYLARKTGAAILPIHVEYSRALRLKSWDRFQIPLPFTKVRVTCDEPVFVAPNADVEAERARIEKILQR